MEQGNRGCSEEVPQRVSIYLWNGPLHLQQRWVENPAHTITFATLMQVSDKVWSQGPWLLYRRMRPWHPDDHGYEYIGAQAQHPEDRWKPIYEHP